MSEKIELKDILSAIEKANENQIKLFLDDLKKVTLHLEKDDLSNIMEKIKEKSQ